jgi:hypothetical protein
MMDLKWTEPSDVCKLVGRYNAEFGHHNILKVMSVDYELNWSAYKETVAGSQDKYLELFSTSTVGALFGIDLNRHAFPCTRDDPFEDHGANINVVQTFLKFMFNGM